MTTALDRTRALLDTPAPRVIPGQLAVPVTEQEHQMPDRPAHFPALAVACPACGSKRGALCTSHSGTRVRRSDVHQLRTAAHVAAQLATTAPRSN